MFIVHTLKPSDPNLVKVISPATLCSAGQSERLYWPIVCHLPRPGGMGVTILYAFRLKNFFRKMMYFDSSIATSSMFERPVEPQSLTRVTGGLGLTPPAGRKEGTKEGHKSDLYK